MGPGASGGEGAAVLRGRRAEDALEVQPQVRAGTETDACGDLAMFKAIAEKVGPNLTTKNWQKTVDSFGKIELPPNKYSSLCKGKYDAQDDFQLISYDSSIGTSGDWKTLTPVKDASGGKCTKS